ncbi:MAG: 4Fe-4S binding protein [Zestosphaera sp.]
MSVKLAVVPLSSCDGCQYNLVDESFLSFLERNRVEIAHWPLVGVRGDVQSFDVALIEGSVISDRDLELLAEARRKSKILVAVGACALLGGVQAGVSEVDRHPRLRLSTSKPVGHYVKIDYYVRGCPVSANEVVSLLEGLLGGRLTRVGEGRFNYVERTAFRIEDPLLKVDSSKCVVCGRCVEACSRAGAKVLNYVNRGIHSIISTPYQEPFEKVGCIYCGLCVAYCPVGAINFKLDLENFLTGITEGVVTTAYIEPEALAALAESECLEPEQVISAMKILGLSRVVIYSSPHESGMSGKAKILPRSPAEKVLLSKLLPNADMDLTPPKLPPDVVYVTQCLSWKRTSLNVITARELQALMGGLDHGVLDREEPDGVSLHHSVMRKVVGLEELKKLTLSDQEVSDKVVFEVCPGGCLLGGGQPISLSTKMDEILRRRLEIFNKIIRKYRG